MAVGLRLGLYLLVLASLRAEAVTVPPFASIQVLEDASGTLTLDQVQARQDWAAADSLKSLNLGLTSAAYWLQLWLVNAPAPAEQLVVENPILDALKLYRPIQGLLPDVQVRGHLVGNENRFGSRHLVFDLLPGVRGPYYLRVATCGPMQVPLTLRNEANLYREAREDAAIFGAMAAVILAFALYNALMYFSIRRASYLYYASYGVNITLLFLTTEGLLPDFIGAPMRPLMVHIAGGFAFASLVMFTRRLIGTHRAAPRLDRVMRAIALGTAAVPIGAMIKDVWLWHAVGPVAACACVLVSLAAALKCARRRPIARVFAAAFLAPIIGTVFYAAQIFELLPTNSITLHSVHIGVCVEVILFSQALALVINRLHRLVTKKTRILKLANRSLSREIAERKRSAIEVERQRSIIIHTAKMRELGMITAAIAHDIATPLTILKMSIDRLDDVADKRHPVEDRLASVLRIKEILSRASNRLSDIVQNTLRFARSKPDAGPSDVAVTQVVDDVLQFCRTLLEAKGVGLEVADVAPIQLRCRPIDLSQILMNLINNAADALQRQEKRKIRISCGVEAGFALLRVEDNGPGVRPEDVPKLMQDSFTTKNVGEGTGIGLSISKLLTERNGGTLTYQRDGGMTAFVVRVPLADASVFAEPIAAAG